MHVGYLKPSNHEANSHRRERRLLGLAYALGHDGEVGGKVRLEIQPVVDLGDGDHQGVTVLQRID